MPFDQTHEPHVPDKEERAELLRRASAAWFRAGGTVPPGERSAVKVRKGLAYVVLADAESTLAVYRVRSDNGLLRRMVRWPAGLDG